MIPQAHEVEDLSISQLVALYNAHAETPVKKFSDRKTAIKRVVALIETINANANETQQQETETMELIDVTNEVMNAITTAEQPVEAEQVEQVETQADALPEITDLEHLVLLGVAESDYQDGCDPEEYRQVWSWSVTGYLSSKKAAGGVIASLVKKGLLSHSPRIGDDDECVGFTPLGAKVYREVVQPAPLPTNAKAKRERKGKTKQVEQVETKQVETQAGPASFGEWFDSLFANVEQVEIQAAPKAKRAKKEKEPKPAREPSKVEIMFSMICHEDGALKSELLKVCGWKGCAVALGRACEKAGMELSKVKLEGGDWTYKAVAKAQA